MFFTRLKWWLSIFYIEITCAKIELLIENTKCICCFLPNTLGKKIKKRYLCTIFQLLYDYE